MSKENISPEDVVSNAHKGVYSVSYSPSLLDGSYSSPSTPLTKELVAEAKPSKKHVGDEVAENRSYTGERLFNATIDEYHTNLLKALEEV